MNTFAMKMGGCLVAFFLLMPAGAQAYRYVDSSVQRVSANTYLLTHTYTAGFLNEDVQTPIVAMLDDAGVGEYPRVGFLVDGLGGALAAAQVSALVLSNAAIVNNQYFTVAGKRDMFTLVALVTLPNPNAVAATNNPSLSLRTVPFSYIRDGEKKSGVYSLETTVDEDALILNAGK